MDSNLPPVVRYIWLASVLAQIFVGATLIFGQHYRRLPFFTSYIILDLCQAAFLYEIYKYYGQQSPVSFAAAWWSEGITLTARLCATAEVLRLVIIPYRGIWGLAWRLLASVSLLVAIGVALFSTNNPLWKVLQADRDYHLIFAVSMVACLLMIHHYRISVDGVYKTLLIGFCFYSCVKILLNAAAEGYLYFKFAQFGTIWQTATLLPFCIVLVIWAVALARPLPALKPQQATLPASVYERMSPELNVQLQQINNKLMDFWKIEAPRP